MNGDILILLQLKNVGRNLYYMLFLIDDEEY